MDVEQAIDVWNLFKEYVDKKQIELVAEKFVDLMADYGIDDHQLKELIGNCSYLDEAIAYYLDIDDIDADEEEWDE